MAVSVLSRETVMPSAGLPTRSVAPPLNLTMKEHAARSSACNMPKARKLYSSKGFYSPSLNQSIPYAASDGMTSMPELYGSVIYADGWTLQDNGIGMYRIGTSDDVPFTRMGTARIDASAGGVVVGDTYWSCYNVEQYGYSYVYVLGYDVRSWEETSWEWGDIPVVSTGVAYDRTTGNVYGCFRSDDNRGYVFGTVDYIVRKRTSIKPLERMWSAVAITRKGQLYAIDELGDLYKVDKGTGDMTPVGSTGLVATNPSSACIDPRSGRCFYAVTQGTDGSLYEIDLNTAQATLLYHFPENQEVVGMFVPVPDVDDNAPDAISDLSLSFPTGALSGTVSFTCPSTTFDGQPGEGDITYVVEADGMTMASGQAVYGKEVKAEVKLSVPGNYTFKVYVANAVGNGPPTEVQTFVGHDLPVSPELTATMADGVVTLSWLPVSFSANGGYIDVDNLTYKVTRFPDNEVIAESIRHTSVTDIPPVSGMLTGYWYAVSAYDGKYASADVVSRKFWTGSITPPYSVVFDNEYGGEAFTIHDVNNDGSTWGWDAYDKAFKTRFNRNADMDDWLVTPPFKLEKGKMYMFTAKMRTYLGNPLEVEIRWGTGDTPEALSSVLMEPQIIKNRNSQDYTFYLLPDADGTYYVGIHETTSADNSWFLYVDGISMGAGADAVIPDVVEGFTVTPDASGAKKAFIRLVAPDKDVNGAKIENLTRVDVLRDGTVVKSFDAPEVGAVLEFSDEVSEIGYYKYEALAYNASGAGKKTGVTVFVGANEPAKPGWVKIVETSVPGEVTMTWEEVTTDKDGKPLHPALVTYTIIAASDGDDPVYVAENLKGSSHTFQALNPGSRQGFVGYGLRAHTEGGHSLMAVTDLLPVGTPYPAPWSESFAGGKAESLIRSDNREGIWSIYNDDAGIRSYDNDNGMAAMFGEAEGADATLFSGKISLEGLANPVLMFYTYNIEGDDGDLNEIEVAVNGGDGFKVEKNVMTWTLGEDDGWYLVVVPLDKYKGKVIQFSLRGITYTRKFTLIDNIVVTSLDNHDLRVTAINAPAAVEANKEFFVTVNVENISVNEADHFDVKLFRDGRHVGTKAPAPLGVGGTLVVRFPQVFTVADNEMSEYHAVIEYHADTHPDDNVSDKKVVKLVLPDYPIPRNLNGTADVNSVLLTWDAPDVASAVPDRVTEDFETFESWIKTGAGGWTFVDADQAAIGQIGNFMMPGIDYGAALSWFVSDASLPGLPEAFAAFSGNKCLSTIFCLPKTNENGDVEYIANDDWAISPALFGGKQSVTLMARSLNPYEAEESFEILYSLTEAASPADFILLQKVEKVPGTWTPYSFDMPNGAKRFAIRYNHTYGLSLGIDDVSFIPEGESSLVIDGYNVYRDGKRINTTLVKETSFTEFVQLMGCVTYAVSAVYVAVGESGLSEPLNLGGSGIEQVSDKALSTVSAGRGVIVVANADGADVRVTDMAGRVIASCRGTRRLEIPVASGIYLVKSGMTVVKVMVP